MTTGDAPARLAVVTGEQLRQLVFAHGPLMFASADALARAPAHVATLKLAPVAA